MYDVSKIGHTDGLASYATIRMHVSSLQQIEIRDALTHKKNGQILICAPSVGATCNKRELITVEEKM